MPSISLRWQITLVFVALTLILVAGYSRLSTELFIQGMDNMMATKMQEAARDYRRNTPNPGEPAVHYGFTVYTHLDDVPALLQEHVRGDLRPETLYKTEDISARQRTLLFLFRHEDEAGSLFVVNQISRETVSSMTRSNGRRNRHLVAMISVGSALLSAFIIWWFLRHVFSPVTRLRQWTRELTADKLNHQPPDFDYSELNELAELIRASLASVNESLQRERRFLKHTSHELRTPIATIQNNLELMEKLRSQPAAGRQEKTDQALARIERASATMKILSETLLWLHRQDTEKLPESDVALDELIDQLVDEARHLINNQAVTLQLTVAPARVTASRAALVIVLGNLIRNAFQHTFEGTVSITQRDSTVSIINQDIAGEEPDLGFGLGLQLTEALCDRLGWQYTNEPVSGGHRVKLQIAPTGDKEEVSSGSSTA